MEKEEYSNNQCAISPIRGNQMQSNFYTKNVETDNNLPLSGNNTPILSPINEEDYSNNLLNIGFICQDSHLDLSNSESVSSGISCSNISDIYTDPRRSPRFVSDIRDEFGSISGMEEWPSPANPFVKKNFKRNKPQMFEDEAFELADNFTKKKMSNNNKVVTYKPPYKQVQQKPSKPINKTKAFGSQQSSNEDIRQMMREIEKGQKGGNNQKRKIISK